MYKKPFLFPLERRKKGRREEETERRERRRERKREMKGVGEKRQVRERETPPS